MGFKPTTKIHAFICFLFINIVLGVHSHSPAVSPFTEPNPLNAPSYAPANNAPGQEPADTPSYAPGHEPVETPSHAPANAPSYAPAYTPSYPPPPRKLVAIQGVVYCKSCKFRGVDTLLGASTITGATVKLECNNTKYPTRSNGTTDKNGYFFILAPNTVTSYGSHKCKVSLVSSPLNITCNNATDLHGGLHGSLLRLEKSSVSKPLPFHLYTVGPFAFEPSKNVNCSY